MLLGHVRQNGSKECLVVKCLVVNLNARRALEVVLHHRVSVTWPWFLGLLVLEVSVQVHEHLILGIPLVGLH
jgi:hypothetical protein